MTNRGYGYSILPIMLAESGKTLGRGNIAQRTLAGAIRAYLDAGGRDIDFPVTQIFSLEQATVEYRNKPTNPETLTKFMDAFWADAGQRIGKSIVVDKFPLTAKEIKERQKNGEMAIFVPSEVSRVDLGKIFSKMGSWSVKEGNSVVDKVKNSGWLWIEASVGAPNRNTTERQLEDIFKKVGKQGQSLRTYIIGSQIGKLLTDKYFDQGWTWSRLLGSGYEGRVLNAGFYSGGDLLVRSDLSPELHGEGLGGRAEEVVKP